MSECIAVKAVLGVRFQRKECCPGEEDIMCFKQSLKKVVCIFRKGFELLRIYRYTS